MQLLSATPSPFARKVRIALAEKGIDFELVTEVPWNADASAPRYNPLGTVPVLIDGDGVYYDSTFIVQYLELAYPQPPLLPRDVAGVLAHRRLEVLGDGVCDAVVLTVIEGSRPPELRSAPWVARQRAKIDRTLAEMARLVDAPTAFACGEVFGLGDIALGCALGYLDCRLAELDWRTPNPSLAALFERLSARPSFQATVPAPQTLRDRVA